MSGLLLLSGLFGLSVAMIIGVVVIVSQRRSTQQDALLWALAVAAERGMPLAPTFDAFAGQCRGAYRRKVLAAGHSLRQGLSLPETLDRVPGLFPREVGVLIRVGNESGVLAGALREASAMRSAARGPWVKLALRIIYLLFVLIIMQTIMAFLGVFIMPKFEAIFGDFGIPLPPLTMITLEAGHFMTQFWPLVLLLIAFQVGLLLLTAGVTIGVLPWDLPLIDRPFLRRHSALVLRCLARVVEGGKPLSQGMDSLARTYPAAWIRRRLRRVAEDIQHGDDWCESLARRGLVRPAEAVLLESARRVGNLPWALREAAESSERRLGYRMQLWAHWLLPLIVLAIGVMVLVVVVSYFSPLLYVVERLAG
jgi:type II secretory pathway component PulF